jgi:hypothetical protein
MIKSIGMHMVCMWEMRNVYKICLEMPEGKRQLGRPRYSWEDNIKMDLRDIGFMSSAHKSLSMYVIGIPVTH